MGGDRRAVPEPLLLLWYVAIAPIGVAAAAAAFADALIPPLTPPWLRGVCVILAGVLGLLVGGAVGSYAPRSVAFPAERRRAVRTFVLTTAAASVVLISTGTPLPWMYTVSGALIATITIAWTLRRSTR